MEQRYVIDKDLEAATLTIKEMAETDVSKFSVLHKESFELAAVEAAVSEGVDALIALFRSHDFYPPRFSAETLAQGILAMFREKEKTTLKVSFCDNDALESNQQETPESLVTDEKELVEIDKLLEDDDEALDGELDS